MIKAKINGSEIVLDDGSFRSDNAELLELSELLSDGFDREIGSDYQPDYELAKMTWIADRLKGSIIYRSEPELDPVNVIY